jgi:hypothetical protein
MLRVATGAICLFQLTAMSDGFALTARPTAVLQQQQQQQEHCMSMSRRELLHAMPAAVATVGLMPAAQASGGATAGKTTSIPRAKIRYYGRMAQVLSAYNALAKAIDSGDVATIKAAKATFFAENDEAPAVELKSAGYLLAVAFKM